VGGGGGGNWLRRRVTALGFGGLLLERLAYVGCGGLRRAVGEKPHDTRSVPLTERNYAKCSLYKIGGGLTAVYSYELPESNCLSLS